MRKIKPIATMIVLLLITALAGIAQSNSPYLFFKPIYAFTTGAQQLDVSTTIVNGQELTKGIYGSFGHGFSFAGGIGKMINSTLGIEVGAEYLLGKKIVTNYADAITDQFSDKVDAVSLKPVLVIRSSGDLLAIYSKLGLAILVYSRRYEDNLNHDTIAGQDFLINSSAVENIKPKVGFTAAFGLSFRVSQAVSIFGEVNGQLMSLPIYKGHYTSFLENGVDKLPTLSVHDKQWVYQKTAYLNNQPEDKPQTLIYNPPNFSYIGISIGMTYHF